MRSSSVHVAEGFCGLELMWKPLHGRSRKEFEVTKRTSAWCVLNQPEVWIKEQPKPGWPSRSSSELEHFCPAMLTRVMWPSSPVVIRPPLFD